MAWYMDKQVHLPREIIELAEKIFEIQNILDKNTEDIKRLKVELESKQGKYNNKYL